MENWMSKNSQKHLCKKIIKNGLPYKIIENYYKVAITKMQSGQIGQWHKTRVEIDILGMENNAW